MLRFETKRDPEELFTREVVAGLAVWVNALVFALATNFSDIVRDYVESYAMSKIGKDMFCRIEVEGSGVYSVSFYTRNPQPDDEFRWVWLGTVKFRLDSYSVKEVLENYVITTYEELKEVAERLGKTAYSVVMALLDALPRNPACQKTKWCWNYLEDLAKELDRVVKAGVIVEVDPEVYEHIHNAVEKGAVPFRTWAKVGEDEVDHLYRTASELARSIEEEGGKALKKKVSNTLRNIPIDGRKAQISVDPPTTVKISIGLFEVNMHAHRQPPGLVVSARIGNGRRAWLTADKFMQLLDTLSNWYEHTVHTLEKAAEYLETSNTLPPKTAKALSEFLLAWKQMLVKHGKSLESEKVIW
ncbi:MAG: hypothetical protein QXD83_04140 [Sulfolobales archaeon]